MKPGKIHASKITAAVKELCVRSNIILRPDVLSAIKRAHGKERLSSAKSMLSILIQNAGIAEESDLPICQDTGMVTVFVELGVDAVITGGNIKDAINDGVKAAYAESFFRNSVVSHPIKRLNTGTNTPAVIHFDPVPGSRVRLTVMPKGFGSENKSRLCMMNPTAGIKDIIDFCVDSVRSAGADACPPYVLGVGIGGTMEECALLAKKALIRKLDKRNPDTILAKMEKAIERKSNGLGIGVMGMGGGATVLGVSILSAPTHIAGLPVAVNISCHALRGAQALL
jgi:fumarate hydratase subunit alpha